MNIDGALVGPAPRWAISILYALPLLAALRIATWRQFRDSEQLHVFLGTTVALVLLSHVEAKVQPATPVRSLFAGITALLLCPRFGSVS